jgi:hypothetical protein
MVQKWRKNAMCSRSTFARFLAAPAVLLAAASHCVGATATLIDGCPGGWYAGCNWSTGTVPTLADDVIIPTGYAITLTSPAYANTITLQGTSTITVQGTTFEVDGGGNNPSSIGGFIELEDSSARLKLTGTQMWTGAGSIVLDDSNARIQISSGATWTVAFNKIHGYGTIEALTGSATLKLDNGADVIADSDGNYLELFSDLILDDTSTNNIWGAESGGALEFNRAATSLVGTLACGHDDPEIVGHLVFNDDVTTAGVFGFYEGTVTVTHDHSFTYETFAWDDYLCPNPGSGSGPFTLSGPVGSGVTVVTCPE